MHRDAEEEAKAKGPPCAACERPAHSCDVWGFRLCLFHLAHWYEAPRFKGNLDAAELAQRTRAWVAELKREAA